MPNPIKILAGVVAVALAAAGIYGWFAFRSADDPNEVRVSGNIEVTDVEVSFKIPGRVAKRLVDEGDSVQAGAPVAELETADLEAEVQLRRAELDSALSALKELETSLPLEIRAAEAARRKAEAAYEDLKAGSRDEEKAMAEADLAAAQQEYERAEKDFGRVSQLYEQKIVSKEEYDRADMLHRVAQERLRQAEQRKLMTLEGFRRFLVAAALAAKEQADAEYDRVAKGPREEKNRQAAAKVEQARAALALAETRLAYAKVVAPLSGVVLSKNVEPGEYVAPGTPVVTIGDLVNVWLRAYIEEPDLGRVKVGQEVIVTTDTYPGKEYRGRVSFIAPEAEFTPKNVQTQKERVKLVYRIKVDIQNPDMELKPGMPADARILTAAAGARGKP